jgi:glycerol-3-phosphate dehydrogenase
VGAAEFDRDSAIDALGSGSFDLLVVGGGVTGCGVALDAAARGLRTALVEARDFASGTSSKSSKLVHGGLRYLQQHDFHLVYEALHERQRLLRNAPHLVQPVPFLIPLFGEDGVVAQSVARAYSSALWLYDVTGGVRIGRKHRRITSGEALAHFPRLRAERLVASFLYWDAQADDARLTLALARTAAARGAVVANYCPVESLLADKGRIRGARLGDGTVVHATTVVNAGGVWSAEIGRRAPSGAEGIAIRPAKGIHVTVRSERLPCEYAAVLAVPGDRRSIFVVPWAASERQDRDPSGRYTYMGTTDTDYEGPLDEPRCSAEDIAYLLKAVNAWTDAELGPRDVTASWAGLRPLISDARSARTADLSRRHRVVITDEGLVTVTGGKLTTYRRMAADTVDAAVGRPRDPLRRGWTAVRGRRAPFRPRSTTARLTLIGGDHGGRPPASALAQGRRLGLAEPELAHLAARHGSETGRVLDLCIERPELARPLHRSLPYLEAEVVWAARCEMALTVTDVLARRTRALILDRAASLDAAPRVAELLGGELGLDPSTRSEQLADFVRSVESELAAEAGSGAGSVVAP